VVLRGNAEPLSCNLDKRQLGFFIFSRTQISTFLSGDRVCVNIFCKEFILRTFRRSGSGGSKWSKNMKSFSIYIFNNSGVCGSPQLRSVAAMSG